MELPLVILNLLTTFFFLWYVYSHDSDLYEERQRILEMQRQERKDLYDRLMAGSLPAYKEQVDEAPAKPEAPVDDRFVDLEDAREEIVNG